VRAWTFEKKSRDLDRVTNIENKTEKEYNKNLIKT
jgi:hypothetical protein